MTDHVDFDAKKTQRLRASYQHAVDNHLCQFNFEGHEYLTGYAKYLLEYLEDMFSKASH